MPVMPANLEHATSAKPCFATNATPFVPGTWSEPSLQTAALEPC